MRIIKKNNRRFLVTRWFPYPEGLAFIFFIVVRNEEVFDKDPHFVNHELIHFRQQQEMAWVLFFLIYFLHGLYILCVTWSWRAVRKGVCFEQEAWEQEANHEYLKNRPRYAWLKVKYFRLKT